MKYALALLLTCCVLCAQGTLPASPTGLQQIQNPNDERFKVFKELEAKAEAGDTESMRAMGEYYYYGRFPVVKDQDKAKEIWIKGASLGSDECAASVYAFSYGRNSNDSEEVIERTKWYIIHSVLSRINRFNGDVKYPTSANGVSESSFEDAKARAVAFLAGVKVSKSAPKTSSIKGSGAASDYAGGVRKLRVPGLKFESLSLFDAHRKNVSSAYLKASSPIYSKGEGASDDEKAAFISAAAEVARLQNYIGKSRRLSLSSKSNAAMRAVNSEKMNECYAKMSAAKIAITLPATRAELNEASIYINALGQLMQLPVSLGGEY
jgi:hypothetical protein